MCKINVLIADDSTEKLKHIRSFLDSRKQTVTYEIAQDLINCKKELIQNQYDILLLDLLLPLRGGDDAHYDESINILKELKASLRMHKPIHIILFTEYKEKLSLIENDLKDFSCEIIIYRNDENGWEYQIDNCLDHCFKFKNYYCSLKSTNQQFDIALIAALPKPELEQILQLSDFEEFDTENDSTIYYKSVFTTNKGRKITVVAASSNQMGMVAATDLTNKIIFHFKPKIVIMCGIAAGISGNFGDILIAKSCDDYGNGKLESKREMKNGKMKNVEEFKPDPNQVSINADLESAILQLIRKRTYLDEISESWKGEKPDNKLGVKFGPFASGASVIASKKFIEERLTKHARKRIGIDMEAYGVYYACYHGISPKPKYFLSIKSISDKGDNLKNDKYQEYASFTSAQYAYHLLTKSDLFDL